MDRLLSETEEDLGLKGYLSSPPSSVLSTEPNEDEMNYLLGINPSTVQSNPVPGTSTMTWTEASAMEVEEKKQKKLKSGTEDTKDKEKCLKEKLKEIESQRVLDQKKLEELRQENRLLRESSAVMPFGFEPERFLNGDMHESNRYLVTTIIPRIKRVVDQNSESFKLIFALGEVCEPLDYKVLRTCMLYNRGGACRNGHTHSDLKGNKRIHSCTICWEVLWIFAYHRVVACPLLTRKFYGKIGAKLIP